MVGRQGAAKKKTYKTRHCEMAMYIFFLVLFLLKNFLHGFTIFICFHPHIHDDFGLFDNKVGGRDTVCILSRASGPG